MAHNKYSTFLMVLLFFMLLCIAAQAVTISIPPVPAKGDYIHDYASLVTSEGKAEIKELQAISSKVHSTPIVVVTIESMAKYGATRVSMESFSKAWFDAWGADKKDPLGNFKSKGILLLVSSGDRKARIELGAEWGHKFDGYCSEIMKEKMVGEFKKGNYSKGIVAGVKELKTMALNGPYSEPPTSDKYALFFKKLVSFKFPFSIFKGPILVIGSFAGVLVLILGFFVPADYKKPVLITGGLIIGIILFTFIAAIYLASKIKIGSGPSRRRFFGGGPFSGGSSG